MLVLHVGRHKCGSSSIQYFMSQNAQKLREFGVLYPKLGRSGHAHHTVASQLKNDIFDGLRAIVALQKEAPDRTVVISSEELGLLRPAQIAQLKEVIGPCPTRIIIYIRNLPGWLASKYSEFTKKGANLVDFDEFYSSHDISRGLRISAIATNWAQVFGWKDVRIRTLDSHSLSGTLIDDFLSVLDLSLVSFGGPQAKGLENRNPSLGWKPLEILRAQFAAVAAHPELYETRKGQSRLSLRISSQIRRRILTVVAEAGLDEERTQYMSAHQWAECEAAFRRELETLNGLVIGPRLPIPDQTDIQERPFLPTIQQIPPTERQEVRRRLHAMYGFWQSVIDAVPAA